MQFVFLAASLPFLIYAFYRSWQGSPNFLPTLGWLFLIALPFCAEYAFFNPATRDLHGSAVTFFLCLLFAADLCATKINDGAVQTATRQPLWPAHTLAAGFVALSLSHLAGANEIPLIGLLTGVHDSATIAHIRNVFSRSESASLLTYARGFSICLMAVPAVVLYAQAGKKIPAAMMFVWLSFYAVSSTAKGPLLLALIALAYCAILTRTDAGARRTAMRLALVTALSGIVSLGVLDMTKPHGGLLQDMAAKAATSHTRLAADARHPAPALGDFRRMSDAIDLPPATAIEAVQKKADYALYRMFVTPVEVAARWYEYAYLFPVSRHGTGRMLYDNRTQSVRHPANAVGLWAYHEPYPAHYSEENYSYTSADADAYLRYGTGGVIAAGLLLFGLRVGLSVCNDFNTFTRGTFTVIGIILLTLLPSSASVQAIAVSQGFILLFPLLAGIRLLDRRARA